MKYTDFLKLRQPEFGDPANILDISENMGALDASAKGVDTALKELQDGSLSREEFGQFVTDLAAEMVKYGNAGMTNVDNVKAALDWVYSSLANKVDRNKQVTPIKNFNDLPEGYNRIAGTIKNSPTGNDSFNGVALSLEFHVYKMQQAISYNAGISAPDVFIRDFGGDRGWSPWVCLVTAGPPQKYNIPLSAGFRCNEQTYFYVDQFGKAHVEGTIQKSTGELANLEVIATLPPGFRPSGEPLTRPANYWPTPTGGLLSLKSTGEICARVEKTGLTSVWFQFSFYI